MSKKTPRKCGICRKPGHNRRTCEQRKMYLEMCQLDLEDIDREEDEHMNATCCICLEEGNVHLKLKCGHFVHDLCVWKWIKSKGPYAPPDCPVCRQIFTFTRDSLSLNNICTAYDSDNNLKILTLDKHYGGLIAESIINPEGNQYEMERKPYGEKNKNGTFCLNEKINTGFS